MKRSSPGCLLLLALGACSTADEEVVDFQEWRSLPPGRDRYEMASLMVERGSINRMRREVRIRELGEPAFAKGNYVYYLLKDVDYDTEFDLNARYYLVCRVLPEGGVEYCVIQGH